MNQKRLGTIWLVGLSGAGKSTVGPLLGRMLKRPFVDTDKVIVRRERRSIAQIFAENGERYFRRIESELIRELAARKRPLIVALGGGAFQPPANRSVIQSSGFSVYLKTPIAILYSRLAANADRPLLNVKPKRGQTLKSARLQRLRQLLAKRSRNFDRADIRLNTTRLTPLQVARNIVRQLEVFNA